MRRLKLELNFFAERPGIRYLITGLHIPEANVLLSLERQYDDPLTKGSDFSKRGSREGV